MNISSSGGSGGDGAGGAGESSLPRHYARKKIPGQRQPLSRTLSKMVKSGLRGSTMGLFRRRHDSMMLVTQSKAGRARQMHWVRGRQYSNVPFFDFQYIPLYNSL